MNIEKFSEILNLSPTRIFERFIDFALEVGYTKDDIWYEPNVFLAIRGTDIGFVSHVDTVWDNWGTIEVEVNKMCIKAKEENTEEGIGADDRLGICALMELLETYDDFRPSIFLCNFEEIGGYGAKVLSEYYYTDLKLRALIELDRHGENDAVFYHPPTTLFRNIVIKGHKFKEAHGSFSDISFLTSGPVFGRAPQVNLSIGYMYEHTPAELVVIPWYDKLLPQIYELYKDLLTIKENYSYASKRFGGKGYDYESDFFGF